MLLHNAASQKTEFLIVIMLLRCGENSICCVNCHLEIIHEFKIMGDFACDMELWNLERL
jgi:hypothetical protein